MKTIVVIPIHKKEMKKSELASLKQVSKVLKKFHIEFICPKNLNISDYEKVLKENGNEYSFRYFDKKVFKSVFSYSHLLLDKNFYKLYSDFDYMLIYQLDAWVFEDKLDYWTEKGYDYIGAPWFEDPFDENSKIIDRSGNGGLSLRKISSMIKLLNTDYHVVLSLKEFFEKKKKERPISNILSTPTMFFRWLLQKDRFMSFWQSTNMFEDQAIVWDSEFAMPEFKVCMSDENYKFSFEANPKILYKINENNLPFACHAFERYDYDFFKQFINVEN